MNISDKLLVICDQDIIYCERLRKYLCNKQNFNFVLYIYNDIDEVKSDLSDREIDIMIMDKDLYIKEHEKGLSIKFHNCIILTESENDESLEGVNSNNLFYKYQSAEKLYEKIILMNLNKSDIKYMVQEELLLNPDSSDEEVKQIIDDLIIKENGGIAVDVSPLSQEVFHSIRGLDVLSELLADEDISEIMINGCSNIFIEKNGRITRCNKAFESNEALTDIIHRIVSETNRSVNMSNPIVDSRLSDGCRINVVLEPISLDGPILTVRRFPKNPLNIHKLIALNAISTEVADFLKMVVVSKYNILISGGTGAGKTTFLNSLSSFIPSDERIITIEDSAELKIQGIENLVRLETRNDNLEGTGKITIRDLIKTALRMRPDRIIVGEVRGEEAIDMLQGFSVGQDGSMSTIHANSAEDALTRLETLILLNSDNIPLMALRRQISAGVDLIIHLSRLNDASRKLIEIREVTGMSGENINTNLLFEYKNDTFNKLSDLINTYKLEKAGYI